VAQRLQQRAAISGLRRIEAESTSSARKIIARAGSCRGTASGLPRRRPRRATARGSARGDRKRHAGSAPLNPRQGRRQPRHRLPAEDHLSMTRSSRSISGKKGRQPLGPGQMLELRGTASAASTTVMLRAGGRIAPWLARWFRLAALGPRDRESAVCAACAARIANPSIGVGAGSARRCKPRELAASARPIVSPRAAPAPRHGVDPSTSTVSS